MEKSIKITIPEGAREGHVFATFKITGSTPDAINFLKEHGRFLYLDGYHHYNIYGSRDTELYPINNDIILKIKYTFILQKEAIIDAETIIEQVSTLLEYFEQQQTKENVN